MKDSVKAELLPPNRIVFRDAFHGIQADLVMVWKHNLFSHDVVLRTQPVFPADWNPEMVRLEVVTEFFVEAEPVLRTQTVKAGRQPELDDDAVIHFGSLAMVMGKAFRLEDDAAVSLGTLNPNENSTSVLKQWHRTDDGRRFLIESVNWSAVWPHLRDLPASQQANNVSPTKRIATLTRTWPTRPAALVPAKPIQIASAAIESGGYVVDFTIIPDQGTPTTFATGETYYIKTSYSVGSSVSFQPGSVVKFKNNTYLLLYGSISFPDTLQSVVFTSRNDRSFGDDIRGVSGETDSNGDPTLHKASQALWIYYVNFNTEIKNARIRWAQRGVQLDVNPGVFVTHTVRNTLFEHFPSGTTAIYRNLQSATLSLVNVTKGDVATGADLGGSGNTIGSMTDSLFYTDSGFLSLRTNDGWSNLVVPPDTMGTVGPTYFLTLVNKRVALHGKSYGDLIETATSQNFFGTTDNEVFDPRVVYDSNWGRWIAVVLNRTSVGNVTIRVAISKTSNPLGLVSNWDRYSIAVAEQVPGTSNYYFVDFPTLGYDANGIYIAVKLWYDTPSPFSKWMYKVIPIKKESNGTITIKNTIKLNDNTGHPEIVVQPAVNLDSTATDAWFVGKGAPNGSYGPIVYNRLQWDANGTPIFVGSPVLSSSVTISTSYKDYAEFSAAGYFTGGLPQKTDPNPGATIRNIGGSRLQMAVVRNGFLWTTHHFGLDQGDDTYNGGTVDRLAIGWYKAKIMANGTLSLNSADGAAQGRIFDTAASTPYHYYFPSLTVNSAGDMVISFSGSRGNEYIGCFFMGRRGSPVTMLDRPLLIQAGRDHMDTDRWGDYSAVTMDSDGTFWTIQEYAEKRVNITLPENNYGLWINKIKKNF